MDLKLKSRHSMINQRLEQIWQQKKSLICIGLDPEPSKLPITSLKGGGALFAFCKSIVDATADLVCAYKPQIAYFSAHGAEAQLEQLIAYIHNNYPDVLVVLDAKRGDIDSTATQYAKEAFERYQADYVTLNPYMGYDAVAPFLQDPNKGAFILCKTSNQSAGQLQDLQLVDGSKLYQHTAKIVAEWAQKHPNQLGLVMGATDLVALQNIRQAHPHTPLLVPGIGAQGGDLAGVLAAGRHGMGGLLINASRSILYASQDDDFAEKARQATQELLAQTQLI
jgi:orotidine-5'-phosphate decarboxylase